MTNYAFPRAPRRFLVHLGSKTESPEPKNQNFEKKPSGIHPSFRRAKFQTDMTIYGFPRPPRRFPVHLGSRTRSPGSKNQNFQKMKKKLSEIHQSFKCAKFQTDLTIYAFPRAPQSLQDKQANTQIHTHTHTHTHCQVLAQLKLRINITGKK